MTIKRRGGITSSKSAFRAKNICLFVGFASVARIPCSIYKVGEIVVGKRNYIEWILRIDNRDTFILFALQTPGPT